ncbi:MAG: formylglycine-generating enzyme family protein, partial [Spirulina sp. DLM2.Bin59]
LLNNKSTSGKLLRGGSWGNCPELCRSAVRSNRTRDGKGYGIGFRVVAPRTL